MAERETTARVHRSTVHTLTVCTPYVGGEHGVTLGMVRDFVDAALDAGCEPTTPIRIVHNSDRDPHAARLEIHVRTEEDGRG